MESFEPSGLSSYITLRSGACASSTDKGYLLGWCTFVCANNCSTQACGPRCPSVSPLKVLAFSEQNQGEDCFLQELSSRLPYRWHVADTDPWTPAMSVGASLFVKGRFPLSCMEVETLCFSGRVVLQGTDFWKSSVHSTVSHPQSTCQSDQQMLAGLHHGQAVSGPQWEPPWPQTQTPGPALTPCGMSCRMLPFVTV